MTNDLRIEARFRNNVLWHAIHDVFPSVAAFCRAQGFRQDMVGTYLNLRRRPFGPEGWHPTAQRLADWAGLECEALFPPILYTTPALHQRRIAEVPALRLVALSAARAVPALEASCEEVLAHQELVDELIPAALNTLTVREEQVLRLRFGFDGEDPHTLEAIGAKLGVGKARALQIEAKALRKLRHPSRNRPLRAYAP